MQNLFLQAISFSGRIDNIKQQDMATLQLAKTQPSH